MIVKAKYVRLSVCKCGFPAMRENVPLGKIYLVDPSTTVHGSVFCGGCGQRSPCAHLMVVDEAGHPLGRLPLGVLEFDEGAAA